VSGRNVVGRWTRTHSPQSETSLQVFADYSSRREYLLDYSRATLDVDFQHRQALGPRHDLVWGLGYRRGHSMLTNSAQVFFADTDRRESLFSAFAEDEIAVVPERLTLTVGMKVERNIYTGVELQPNVRALWAVDDRQAIWGAVTRGVRTPSLFENGANVDVRAIPGPQGVPLVIAVIGRGTPQAERLWANEVGYRRHWSTVSLDVSAFRNNYAHLLSLTPGAPEFVPSATPFVRLPFLTDADLRGRSYGLEAAAMWRVRQGWTLTSAYTYLTLDLTSDGKEGAFSYEQTEDDSPRHRILLRSLTSFSGRWEADATVHGLGSSDAGSIPAYARLDARIGFKVSDRLKISLAGHNLLDHHHLEWASILTEEITQPRRGVLLQTTWTF
jgi:iron complex outermembrane receptor protein